MEKLQSASLIGKWRTRCGALATVAQTNPGGYLGTVRICRGQLQFLHRDMDFPCAWNSEGKCKDYKDGEWDLLDRVRPGEKDAQI